MLYFLIPAYNEGQGIKRVLRDVSAAAKRLRKQYKIVVVDDGSRDETVEAVREVAKRNNVLLLEHGKNRGPGAAFRTGFKKVLELARDNDVVVTMEADASNDLVILDKMLAGIQRGSDIVLASCYAPEGRVVGDSPHRLFLSKAINSLLKLFFPIPGVHTYTGFFRAHRASVVKKAFSAYGNELISEDGFGAMTSMLVKFSRFGAKISEVPLVLRVDKVPRASKMKVVKTIWEYLKLFARNLFGGRPRKRVQ
jgi:dolichol-phosphate mannosyltransferase